MNDGGGEIRRDNEIENAKKNKSGGGDFGRSIAKIAVAQICESAGFQSFQQSALDALSDIAIRYLCSVGKSATSYANLAGRTECNVVDIVQALEDLGSSQGFIGASEINRCLLGSGTVREIAQYVNLAEEIPFARSIPCFPIIRNRRPGTDFPVICETPTGEHIPPWLPAFPDPHTYAQNPVCNDRVARDLQGETIERAMQQRRNADRALSNLQQRVLVCNGTMGSSSASMHTGDNEGKAKQIADSNPFLAPPLLFGEKEVSQVLLPNRFFKEATSVSMLETVALAVTKGGSCDSQDIERKVLPSKRPPLCFKLGVKRKPIKESLDLEDCNTSIDKMASCYVKDKEKDERKWRAELILKEAMDNPKELAQL